MNLADRLSAASEREAATKREIISEIRDYFQEYIDSGAFEKVIEQRILNSNEAKLRRRSNVSVEFWRYQSGCSGTSWRVGNKYWKNPEESEYSYSSHDYKGISLSSIQEDVGTELCDIVVKALRNMGFTMLECQDKKGRLGLYHTEIAFNW